MKPIEVGTTPNDAHVSRASDALYAGQRQKSTPAPNPSISRPSPTRRQLNRTARANSLSFWCGVASLATRRAGWKSGRSPMPAHVAFCRWCRGIAVSRFADPDPVSLPKLDH